MIAELVEKRIRIHNENTAILQKAKADGRDVLNPDEELEWQKRDAAIDDLGRQIERYKKQALIDEVLNAPEERKADPNPVATERRTSQVGQQQLRQGRFDVDMALRGWFLQPTGDGVTEAHRMAAQRVGLNLSAKTITLNLATRALQSLHPAAIASWESRAQTLTTTGGGYTVPDETMQSIEKAMLWYGPMREVATIVRTATGADMPWPTVNDTGQVGVILDINTQVANQDVAFNQIVLKAFKYSSKQVLVPIELMQDSATDLPSLLGDLLGERIGRIQNTHLTTGAGTTLPFGIVVQATAGPAPTGTAANGFTYPNIVDLEHSVDVVYRRQGAAFMTHDVTVAKLKKLLDTTNRPIWQPSAEAGMAQGAPSTLLGYPVYINNDMSTAQTTGTRAILFGNLKKYLVREVLGIDIIRLDERYADFHQVAFLAIARMDGNLLNAGTNPVKYMSYTT